MLRAFFKNKSLRATGLKLSGQLVRSFPHRGMANHALIVGGGRAGRRIVDIFQEALPEESELLSCQTTYNKLLQSQQFTPDNIKILFGKEAQAEDKTIKTIMDPRCFVTWINKKLGNPTHGTHEISKLAPLNGSATYENLMKQFRDMSEKATKDDKIFIFLYGHGAKLQGMVLWNESKTKHILTIPMLQKMLAECKTAAKIYICVESCYSGIYNLLANKNVVVVTSGNINKVSYYKPGLASTHIDQILHYFQNKTNLLKQHATGALKSKSFYPSDSVSYFVDNQLNQSLSPHFNKLKNKYYKFKSVVYYGNTIIGRRSDFVKEMALATAIIIDPFNVLGKIYSAKVFGAFAKLGFAGFKFLTYMFAQNAYVKIQTKIQNTEIYKNHPVRLDKKLVKKMERRMEFILEQKPDLLNDTSRFLAKNKEKIFFILSNLKDIQDTDLTTPVQTPYNYLLKKVVLYFLDSIVKQKPINELNDFIQSTCFLLSPLHQENSHRIKALRSILIEYRREIIIDAQWNNNENPTLCFLTLESNKDDSDRFLKFFINLLVEVDLRQKNCNKKSNTQLTVFHQSSSNCRPAACPRDPEGLSLVTGSRGQAAGRRTDTILK